MIDVTIRVHPNASAGRTPCARTAPDRAAAAGAACIVASAAAGCPALPRPAAAFTPRPSPRRLATSLDDLLSSDGPLPDLRAAEAARQAFSLGTSWYTGQIIDRTI